MNRQANTPFSASTAPNAASAAKPRAKKSPFSPQLKLALVSGLVVLAAALTPTARALASADDHSAHGAHQHGHGQHGKHHGGGKHMGAGHMGGMHMSGMHAGGMQMDGMGLGMGQGRHAERLLDSVGATAEQKAQIRQIGAAARADIQAQREAGSGLREQARALMAQPDIDANAVEALRQQMLAQHDQSSRRKSQALVEMGRVLTPDQRQALAEQMAKRHDMMKQRRAERMAAPAR